MFSSFNQSGGSCLPPQLPPLPPPPSQFFNQEHSSNWILYSSPQSFSFPPAPPLTCYPSPHCFPSPIPPPPPMSGALLPHPPIQELNKGCHNSRGRGGRGGGRGGHVTAGGRARQKWKLQKCEPCDRVYKTEETFAEHIRAHIKCTQCDFTALPKKVKDHSQVHTLPDFLSFSSPNDITKWREERKKNYPTISNVAKKKKLEEKKRDRGQVVDTPLYRYVNRLIGDYDNRCRGRGERRMGGHQHRGRGGRWNSRRHNNSGGRRNDTNKPSCPHEANADGTLSPLKSAAATAAAITTPNEHDSGGTSTTIASTIGSRTSEDQSSSIEPCGKSVKPFKGKRGGRRSENKRRHTFHSPTGTTGPVKRTKQCSHWTDLPLSTKPTLLEKLLASEVRSEHNAILQCVRYIVKNDFFTASAEPSATTTSNSSCTLSEE